MLCWGVVSCPRPAGVLLVVPSTPRPYPRPCISFRTFFSAEIAGTWPPSSTAAARLPLSTPLTGVPLQVLGIKAELGHRRQASRTGASSWE